MPSCSWYLLIRYGQAHVRRFSFSQTVIDKNLNKYISFLLLHNSDPISARLKEVSHATYVDLKCEVYRVSSTKLFTFESDRESQIRS